MSTTQTPPSDEDLAGLARAGCLTSFEELVLRYEKRIYHFLLQRTGCSADASDLAQQTFVRAWRNRERYHVGRRFSPWLFTIAGRLAISAYRRRRDEPLLEQQAQPGDGRTPFDDVAGADTARCVWSVARRTLAPRQYTALWLRIEEELAVSEVASALRVTTTHAKVILHRARRALIEALGAEGDLVSSTREGLAERERDRANWMAAVPCEGGLS